MGKFYYPYEKMLKELRQIQKRYPGQAAVREAGRSVLGKWIPEVLIGEETADCPHVLIHAGLHGREYLNCALVIRQTEDFLREKREMGVCFHVLPMVNPDGVDLCHKRGYERWKANGRGVDLNRNFDAGWEQYQGEAEPGMQGYKGEAPDSEPEVQAILRLQKQYPFSLCISYHSTGSMIYWDYGSSGRLGRTEKKLAEMLSEVTGYALRSTVDCGADEAGCSDYFVQKCGIPAVTIETGKGPCPLDKEEFPAICRENRRVWEAAARFALESHKMYPE